MPGLMAQSGLSLQVKSPPDQGREVARLITEEAGITFPDKALRLDMLVSEGDLVPQGAPLARLRDAHSVHLVAPMPARVAQIRLNPGRRLSEIILFHEAGGDRHRIDLSTTDPSSAEELRLLIQNAGLWPLLERRPFGGMPKPQEQPVGIIVMASDSRPLAPDPILSVKGEADHVLRGLEALGTLTDGNVFLCHTGSAPPLERQSLPSNVVLARTGARHPLGLSGFCVHSLCPAAIDHPVWSCHFEDVAAIGELLNTGFVRETRLVHVACEGLRRSRLIRTQPGADLRDLVRKEAQPGPHQILSGSPLDGRPAHWLGPRSRQVSVIPTGPSVRERHWFLSALSRSALPLPVIPTKALSQAFGEALPSAAFVRALSAGDEETAMKLGVLSLLEEDVALADYVLGGEAHLGEMLKILLARIEEEMAP